jgi:GNAT superfamily N-acetyltransferase
MSKLETAGMLVERAGPQHGSRLQDFFAAHSHGCFCQWWDFPGDKNAWQLRCAQPADPAQGAATDNEQSMLTQLAANAPQMHGFVALQGSQAVGWLKLSPAQHIPKLYDQRLYRGLPCFAGDRTGVYTVGCLLVSEQRRRTGIARALLRHAVAWAREHGVRALEAFPHRSPHPHPAGLWLGPYELYQELGFQTAYDFEPYPVLRLVF